MSKNLSVETIAKAATERLLGKNYSWIAHNVLNVSPKTERGYRKRGKIDFESGVRNLYSAYYLLMEMANEINAKVDKSR